MRKMILFMLCCLLLVGCTAAPAEPSVPTTAATVQVPTIAETTLPETTVLETTVPQTTAAPEHFITLYAPNEDATGFIYASIEVPELSAHAICDALIEAGVLREDVQFNSLTVENGEVKLDVNDAFGTQLMSYGTAGEYMMMGSVVNTLLSAYDAQTVSITMDGQIMESGHVIYDFPQTVYE